MDTASRLLFTIILALVLCGCASFTAYNPADKNLGFHEDFEGDLSGTWPCRWIADGNATELADCHIDSYTFEEKYGNVLRLQSQGDSWASLAHVKPNIEPPFRVMFNVFLDPKTPDVECVVGLRTQPSWEQPGLLLLSAPANEPARALEAVEAGGTVLPGQCTREVCLKTNRWYRVDLQYKPGRRRTEMVAVVSNGFTSRGPITLVSEGLSVPDMPYFQLEVRNGTAWFDNISITPLDWKR